MASRRFAITAVGCLCLAACSKEPTSVAPPAPAAVRPVVTQAEMDKWRRSCVLCHMRGEGGAPRLGRQEDWTARVAQGEDVMIRHAVEGYNNMPPLGYCMDCEEDDFRALTRYMAGTRP